MINIDEVTRRLRGAMHGTLLQYTLNRGSLVPNEPSVVRFVLSRAEIPGGTRRRSQPVSMSELTRDVGCMKLPFPVMLQTWDGGMISLDCNLKPLSTRRGLLHMLSPFWLLMLLVACAACAHLAFEIAAHWSGYHAPGNEAWLCFIEKTRQLLQIVATDDLVRQPE